MSPQIIPCSPPPVVASGKKVGLRGQEKEAPQIGEILVAGAGGSPIFSRAWLHDDMTGLFECTGCKSKHNEIDEWRIPLRIKTPCHLSELGQVEVRVIVGENGETVRLMKFGIGEEDEDSSTTSYCTMSLHTAICGPLRLEKNQYRPILAEVVQESPQYVRVKGRIVEFGSASWMPAMTQEGSAESVRYQMFLRKSMESSPLSPQGSHPPQVLASYASHQKGTPDIPIFFEEVALTVDHLKKLRSLLNHKPAQDQIGYAIARKFLHEGVRKHMIELGSKQALEQDAMDVVDVALLNDCLHSTKVLLPLVENLTRMHLRFQKDQTEDLFLEYGKSLSTEDILGYDDSSPLPYDMNME